MLEGISERTSDVDADSRDYRFISQRQGRRIRKQRMDFLVFSATVLLPDGKSVC